MDIDHILVFFESPDGRNLWRAVEREKIPDWLREPAIVDRLLKGEQVRNTEEKTERHFKIVEIDRPRQAGQHKLMMAQNRLANGESAGGIILPMSQ